MKKVFNLKSITRALAVVMIIGSVLVGCKSYDGQIDDLNADVVTLKSDVAKDLAALKTQLEATINTEIGKLNAEITTLKADLATKATKAELDAAKAEILSKTVSLEAFNAYKAKVDGEIKALQDGLALAATKAELKVVNDKLDAYILANNAALTALTGRVTELELKATKLAADLENLATLHGQTLARLVIVEGILNVKEGKSIVIEDIKAQLADQLAKINKNIADINDLYLKLSAAEARIKALEDLNIKTRLEALEAKDIVLANQILALQQEVAALKQADINLGIRIDGLQARIVALEKFRDEEVKPFMTEIGLWKTQTETWIGQINTWKGEIDTWKGDMTTWQTAMNTWKGEMEDWQDDMNEWKEGIQSWRTDVVDPFILWAEPEIKDLREEVDILNGNMKEIAKAMSLNFAALSNRLTGLTFVAEYYVNGIPAMDFSPLVAECLTVTPAVQIAYHLSPSFITEEDIEVDNMSFILIKETKNVFKLNGPFGAPSAQSEVEAHYDSIANGKIYVSVAIEDLDAVFGSMGTKFLGMTIEETFPSVALQVPLSEKAVTENKLEFDEDGAMTVVNGVEYPANRVVTASHYVRLDYNKLVAMKNVKLGLNDTPEDTYPLLVTTAEDAMDLTAEGYDLATVTSPTVVFLPYGGTINLADTVAAILNGNSLFDVEKYGLKFKFDLLNESGQVIKYLRNGVDQQQFISITNPALGTVTAAPTVVDSIAKSVGRTPIVRVWMYNDEDPECVILYGFVKVVFEEQPDINLAYPFGTSVASCDTTNWTIPTTWKIDNVYEQAGMTSADFHAAYTHSWTADAGTVTRHGNLANNATLNWSITPQEVWTKLNANPTATEVTFTATFKYTALNQIVNPDFVITMTKTFTRPVDAAKQAILESELVAKYWYDLNGQNNGTVFEEVKSNVHVPAVGENTTANNKYETNLTGAFLSDADKSLMGYDNYQFFFVKDQKTHTINDGQTPTAVTLVPDATGQLLQYGGQTVATINPFATNVGDLIVLNNSSLAKRLLNYDREFLRATLGVRYDYCPDLVDAQDQKIPTTMAVTVAGKATFDVVFVRPLSANGVSGKKFIDGVLFGQTGSYMTIKDLAGLVDWRGTSFTSASHLYGYYGVTAIAVDIAAITTNVNGTWENLSAYPQLEVAVAPSVTGVTPVDLMGYLTYRNNGMTIGTDFQLKVPVTVTHHWGDIKTAIVTVNVEKTIGPSGVIRK